MTDSVSIVTGAGGGIGRAAALALGRDGGAVVLAGRSAASLDATARSVVEAGGRALAVVCDITSPDSVSALFAAAVEAFGRVDVLFNNAGANAPKALLEDMTLEQWQGVIDVNLTGAFLCTQAAFRIMKEQTPRGGRIINNGSVSAQSPRPNSAPYTASKHAMTGLTKCTSLDGRKYDIACGQIDIGNAATDMTTSMATGMMQANGSIATEPTIDARLVGETIAYMAGLPLEANIQFVTVMATKMPLVGRG